MWKQLGKEKKKTNKIESDTAVATIACCHARLADRNSAAPPGVELTFEGELDVRGGFKMEGCARPRTYARLD